jgi:hypothetical protein
VASHPTALSPISTIDNIDFTPSLLLSVSTFPTVLDFLSIAASMQSDVFSAVSKYFMMYSSWGDEEGVPVVVAVGDGGGGGIVGRALILLELCVLDVVMPPSPELTVENPCCCWYLGWWILMGTAYRDRSGAKAP